MKSLFLLGALLSVVSSCTEDFARPDVRDRQDIDNIRILNTDRESGNKIATDEVLLDATVLLSGPYKESQMSIALSKMELLPNSQPYNQAPFHYTGDEKLSYIPRRMVDWVLISLIDAGSKYIIAERAALLTSSGDIVDLDGESAVSFKASPDHYLVAVYHRNHLGVLSDYTVDFTSGVGKMKFETGNSGQMEVSPGVFAMIKGDVNTDRVVNNTDLMSLAPEAAMGSAGIYNAFDVNMDGMINNTDLVSLAPIASTGYVRNF